MLEYFGIIFTRPSMYGLVTYTRPRAINGVPVRVHVYTWMAWVCGPEALATEARLPHSECGVPRQ